MTENPSALPPPDISALQSVPRVYANGLAVGYSKTECVVTFLFANEPLVSVILPFPFARVLSEQVAQIISNFEQRSGEIVKHPNDIIPDLKATKAADPKP